MNRTMQAMTETTSFYEDHYTGVEHETGADLLAALDEWCGPESAFAALNVPVWIDEPESAPGDPCDYCPNGIADPDAPDGELDGDHRLEVGLLMPRHGEPHIWYTDHWTHADAQAIRVFMVNVWAGRAEGGFARRRAIRHQS